MSKDPLVHDAHDGRGPRDCYLNGKPISGVLYANERKGKVVVFDKPLRVHKHGKRAITRTLYGEVKVVVHV